MPTNPPGCGSGCLLQTPFDPIIRGLEVEKLVMKDGARKYTRFRYADFYGGIVTGDAVGCNLLCAYCWNYNKNYNPEGVGSFYSPPQVVQKLRNIAAKKDCNKFRISGSEPFISKASTIHVIEILKALHDYGECIIESNGLLLGFDPSLIDLLAGFDNVLFRITIKGDTESVFERVTGSRGIYQPYQLKAIQGLRGVGLNVSVAFMERFVNPDLLPLDEDFDIEDLRYYHYTKNRLRERRLEPAKEKVKPSKSTKPTMTSWKSSHELSDFWIDQKGDIV